MIKLQNVSKVFELGGETVRAVDDVNLEIRKKEFTSILGTSGSGKSSLMYLIGLLDHPTSGSIYFDDKDVSNLDDDQLSKIRNSHVGFIFQSFNLINKLTAIENVMMPTKYAEKLDFDPRARAEELLERFGILERKNFTPNKISGGQQQRVAIARALIMKPKVILADEPTGNLDSKTGNEILKILRDLNHEFDTSVVIVTHEKEIAQWTKKQIYIKDGKIVDRYS